MDMDTKREDEGNTSSSSSPSPPIPGPMETPQHTETEVQNNSGLINNTVGTNLVEEIEPLNNRLFQYSSGLALGAEEMAGIQESNKVTVLLRGRPTIEKSEVQYSMNDKVQSLYNYLLDIVNNRFKDRDPAAPIFLYCIDNPNNPNPFSPSLDETFESLYLQFKRRLPPKQGQERANAYGLEIKYDTIEMYS